MGTSDHIVMSKSPNKHNRLYMQVGGVQQKGAGGGWMEGVRAGGGGGVQTTPHRVELRGCVPVPSLHPCPAPPRPLAASLLPPSFVSGCDCTCSPRGDFLPPSDSPGSGPADTASPERSSLAAATAASPHAALAPRCALMTPAPPGSLPASWFCPTRGRRRGLLSTPLPPHTHPRTHARTSFTSFYTSSASPNITTHRWLLPPTPPHRPSTPYRAGAPA